MSKPFHDSNVVTNTLVPYAYFYSDFQSDIPEPKIRVRNFENHSKNSSKFIHEHVYGYFPQCWDFSGDILIRSCSSVDKSDIPLIFSEVVT